MKNTLVKIDVERDVNEIIKLVEGYIKTTYVQQIQSEINKTKRICEQNGSKEYQLFRALQPFVPNEKQVYYNEIGKIFIYKQVADRLLYQILPYFSESRGTREDHVKKAIIKAILCRILYEMENDY